MPPGTDRPESGHDEEEEPDGLATESLAQGESEERVGLLGDPLLHEGVHHGGLGLRVRWVTCVEESVEVERGVDDSSFVGEGVERRLAVVTSRIRSSSSAIGRNTLPAMFESMECDLLAHPGLPNSTERKVVHGEEHDDIVPTVRS